jgi:hypothetical protein
MPPLPKKQQSVRVRRANGGQDKTVCTWEVERLTSERIRDGSREAEDAEDSLEHVACAPIPAFSVHHRDRHARRRLHREEPMQAYYPITSHCLPDLL